MEKAVIKEMIDLYNEETELHEEFHFDLKKDLEPQIRALPINKIIYFISIIDIDNVTECESCGGFGEHYQIVPDNTTVLGTRAIGTTCKTCIGTGKNIPDIEKLIKKIKKA